MAPGQGGQGMKKTSQYLQEKKQQGQRIAMLTCYDYPTALWEEAAGVDVMLVGDSVGTNVLGYASAKDVTLQDMLHHLKAVKRGVQSAYLLVDLPYGTYDNPSDALRHAQALQRAGADGVKLEGYRPEIIAHLTGHGVEVCAHLGLTPQIHEKMAIQAKNTDTALQLLKESQALQEAGAFMLLYELIPEEVACQATRRLTIPTIGIGAGRYTDGQVLVVNDMLGVNAFEFRHNIKNEAFQERGIRAIKTYVNDVAQGLFPQAAHVRHLDKDEAKQFARAVESRIQELPARGRDTRVKQSQGN
jgi:3-methyl-2-oxobutanoate hydroxymethyltransferase